MLAMIANESLAQNRVTVMSEEYDDQETTCMTYSHKDRNNKDCALVIFHNVEPEGYYFDTKGVYASAENKVSKNGEKIIYLYISDGAKNITIKHRDEGIGALNYTFENGPLRKLQTYHIYLGEVFRMSEVGSQYLEFTINPVKAILEVEEDAVKFPGVYTPWTINSQGKASKLVRFGKYNYRVSATEYAPTYGTVTVNNPSETVKENISLSPKFGHLTIPTSADLLGAVIYVDGREAGNSQLNHYKLSSGKHVVKITKPLFKLYETEIIITDGNICYLKPVMISNATNLTINVSDNKSEIYLRNGNTDDFLSKGTWSGQLEPGNYLIVARQNGHKDSYKQITVTKTQSETFIIPSPTPLYGSVNFKSTPGGASIYLDDAYLGETPKVINSVLVGLHTIKLTKKGYNDYTTTISVNEDRMTDVVYELNNLCRVDVNAEGGVYSYSVKANGSELKKKNGYYYVPRGTDLTVEIDGYYDYTDKRKTYHITKDKDITIKNHRKLLHYSEFYMDAAFIYGIQSGCYGGSFSMGFSSGPFNMQADLDYLETFGFGGRFGWTFRCGTRFRITPQVGYKYAIEYEHNILGALRMNLSLGYRCTLFVSPEYNFCFNDDGGEMSGFQLRTGLSVNF